MQPYDILMLVVLLVSIFFGALKGMAWQLAAMASLLLSGVVAVTFSGPLAPFFGDEEPWNRCIAMLVLYVGTSLGIWLIFRMVSGIIDRVRLKEFDRQLGAVFGATKGTLWCLIITFFAVTLSEPARQQVLKSRSGFFAAVLIQRGEPLLPSAIPNYLGGYRRQMQEKLDPNLPPTEPAAAGPRTPVSRDRPSRFDRLAAEHGSLAPERPNLAQRGCKKPVSPGFWASFDRT